MYGRMLLLIRGFNRTAACQGLIKKEGKQRFGSQYSDWQRSPATFEISDHAPVRSKPCRTTCSCSGASCAIRESACGIAVRNFAPASEMI